MIKVLILVGGKEQYHDHLFAGQTLQKILIENDIIARYSQDFSILTEERINEYDLCIFYTQDKNLTLDEQKGLKDYIKNGKGFIALHAASVFDESKHEVYKKLVGNKFIEHDPFKRFKVEVEKDSFITENVNDFEIDDELYITELFTEPEQILAWAYQDGKKHPMLYTKKLGEGKICYLALGHDGRAWNNPNFQQLLYKSVLWIAQ